MSTILKALEELEQRAPVAAPPTVPSQYERMPRTRSLTPLLLMLTAGSLVGMLYFAVRGAPKSASSQSVSVQAQRVSEHAAVNPLPLAAPPRDDAPPRAVDAAPARERVTTEEAPWGRVEKGSTIASAAPQLAPTGSARAIVEPAAAPPRPESPPAPVEHKPQSRTPRGADVEVMSIAYSADVTARSTALRIGGQAVTLHQGDSARGVEVQLILPNSVYLRRGRDIFAVDAKR